VRGRPSNQLLTNSFLSVARNGSDYAFHGTVSKYCLDSMIRSHACSSLLLAVILVGCAIPRAAGQEGTASGANQLSVPFANGKETPQQPPAHSGLPVCPIPDSAVVPALHHVAGTHKVTLSWKASAPSSSPGSNAVGYCVYRRKENKSGKNGDAPNPLFGRRERINLLPVPGTTCVDNEVDDDAVYSYVVTAVNANGIPSSPSNEVSAAIPAEEPKSTATVTAPSCRTASDVRLRSGTH
jgi:hypothetical protein